MFSSNTSQVSSAANYIEDVFSTYLYTGTGATQSIVNNIDLSGKGGLTWLKCRSSPWSNALFDTNRGANNILISNNTSAANTSFTDVLTSFNNNGFTVGADSTYYSNKSGDTYASWTFRKQAKFFDVVTYTGNGVAGRTVAHNLGSVPGSIFVKVTSAAGNWNVYHRSLGATKYILLNSTSAELTDSTRWNDTAPTSTEFTLGTAGNVNANGLTYVAYLFAHDAGGFGLTGADNVISCGSYTGNGSASGPVITLGYEPQWVMIKKASAGGTAGNWLILDTMRGFCQTIDNDIYADLSNAEGTGLDWATPTATGFQLQDTMASINNNGATYIYIAIRRGPMKTPTSGTSVYATDTRNAGSVGPRYTSGFPVDMSLRVSDVTDSAHNTQAWDRLRGDLQNLNTNTTAAETTLSSTLAPVFGFNTGIATLSGATSSSSNDRAWMFRRAPSFMDEVCYTGTDNDIALTHNLGVAPEAIILKKRNGSGDWAYDTNFTSTQHTYFTFNDTLAGSTTNYSSGVYLAARPTATTVTVAGGAYSTSGSTYVMYLFASCPGVSKVGSYTGTGTTKQIDCGFTGGARFVLIKRTDSTGAWYVWDSARGIVSGNDPYLLLNSTAAEVTNTDYVDTYSAGFEISSTAPAAINANGGTFIFLAIA